MSLWSNWDRNAEAEGKTLPLVSAFVVLQLLASVFVLTISLWPSGDVMLLDRVLGCVLALVLASLAIGMALEKPLAYKIEGLTLFLYGVVTIVSLGLKEPQFDLDMALSILLALLLSTLGIHFWRIGNESKTQS